MSAGTRRAVSGGMTTNPTTYGDLNDGDEILIQGYWFKVRNLRISSRAGERTTLHGEPNRADVIIRFNGDCLSECNIRGTGYDGGVYGGYADRKCTAIAVERS